MMTDLVERWVPAGGAVYKDRSTDSEAAPGRGDGWCTRDRFANSCASTDLHIFAPSPIATGG
jgi:hypothetical protein